MLTYEASEVIVNSNYMKSEIQRLFGLPFEKINVVPNGVNLNNFNNVYRDYDFRRRFAMEWVTLSCSVVIFNLTLALT